MDPERVVTEGLHDSNSPLLCMCVCVCVCVCSLLSVKIFSAPLSLSPAPPSTLTRLLSIQPDSGSMITCLVLNGVRPQLSLSVSSTLHGSTGVALGRSKRQPLKRTLKESDAGRSRPLGVDRLRGRTGSVDAKEDALRSPLYLSLLPLVLRGEALPLLSLCRMVAMP